MRKLSDIKGEKALDVLAELIEPAAEIFADPEIERVMKRKRSKKLDVAKVIIKNHKKAILHIMAVIDEEDPKEYSPSLIDIPMKIIDILNDPAFSDFFASQGQKQESASSGSATENIVADEK